jgi:hypothetical protein
MLVSLVCRNVVNKDNCIEAGSLWFASHHIHQFGELDHLDSCVEAGDGCISEDCKLLSSERDLVDCCSTRGVNWKQRRYLPQPSPPSPNITPSQAVGVGNQGDLEFIKFKCHIIDCITTSYQPLKICNNPSRDITHSGPLQETNYLTNFMELSPS